MALILNYEDASSGLKVDNVYVNIDIQNVYKDSVAFKVKVYNSNEDRMENKSPINVYRKALDIDVLSSGDNLFKKVYQEIKNMDKYKDAVDA